MAEENKTENETIETTNSEEVVDEALVEESVDEAPATSEVSDSPDEENAEIDENVEEEREEITVEEPGIIEANLKNDLPEIKPGDIVRVHQILKEKNNKERIQVFEGQVLAAKHGKGISGTITVRKVVSGVGVEKIFPIHSTAISKIEVVKRSKTRRAKLYYLRHAKGRKARLKTIAFGN